MRCLEDLKMVLLFVGMSLLFFTMGLIQIIKEKN